MRTLRLIQNSLPRWMAIGTIPGILLFAGVVLAQAGQVQQRISLTAPDSGTPFRVVSATPVTLSNDGGSTLHQATISRMPSGDRLAKILEVQAGQSLNLEFSREGSYSICYFLASETLPSQERCLYLDVVPLRTAGNTGTDPLLQGGLS